MEKIGTTDRGVLDWQSQEGGRGEDFQRLDEKCGAVMEGFGRLTLIGFTIACRGLSAVTDKGLGFLWLEGDALLPRVLSNTRYSVRVQDQTQGPATTWSSKPSRSQLALAVLACLPACFSDLYGSVPANPVDRTNCCRKRIRTTG